MKIWGRRLVGVMLAVLAAACSDARGPSGPGSYTVAIEGGDVPAGAAVVELLGPGILGVESVGSARVYSTPLPSRDGIRVVVVVPGEFELGFRVLVSDLALAPPRGDVVEAAGMDNTPSLAPSTYQVRVIRD
jgi:hypothetical protein